MERHGALTALAAVLFTAGASSVFPKNFDPWLFAISGLLFLLVLFPSLGKVVQIPLEKYRIWRTGRVLGKARFVHHWRCPNGHLNPMLARVDAAQGIAPAKGDPVLKCPVCGAVGGGASEKIEPVNRAARSRYSPYRIDPVPSHPVRGCAHCDRGRGRRTV